MDALIPTAQQWERSWWQSCNFLTFGEKAKQVTYALPDKVGEQVS